MRDAGQPDPGPRREHELHRQHHLAGDHQRVAGDHLVERHADGAADRVLQRYEGRVGVAGPDRVEGLGNAARRRTGAAFGRGQGAQRLLGEGALRAEVDEAGRWRSRHSKNLQPGGRASQAAARMPAGAPVRTGMLHTSVPAVTSRSEPAAPRVTTCSGSALGICTTVHCQVPAHIGPVTTRALVDLVTRPARRRTASTCPAARTAAAGNGRRFGEPGRRGRGRWWSAGASGTEAGAGSGPRPGSGSRGTGVGVRRGRSFAGRVACRSRPRAARTTRRRQVRRRMFVGPPRDLRTAHAATRWPAFVSVAIASSSRTAGTRT